MPPNITPTPMKGRRWAQTGWSLPSRPRARRHWHSWAALLIFVSLVALVGMGVASRPVCAASKPPPNILLIVMDDIGIDQWQLFGYGGPTAGGTPNNPRIPQARVKFYYPLVMPA